MKTRQLFKQRVIELIYDLPYKEAVEKEINTIIYEDGVYKAGSWSETIIITKKKTLEYIKPITLSRVMRALGSNYMCTNTGNIIKLYNTEYGNCINYNNHIYWELLKEDKSTATDDDQTDECIEELYNLIK